MITSGGSERNRATTKMMRQCQAGGQARDDDEEGKLDRDHHAGQDVRQVLEHDLGVEERIGEAIPVRQASQCRWIWPMKARVRSWAGFSKIAAGGPSSTMAPSSMNRTRSAALRAKPISWLTTIMVMPLSRRERMTSSTQPTSSGSM